VGALVLGSLGVLGMGLFAVLGIKGYVDLKHLEDSCSPRCGAGQADSVRTELRVGDAGLLVGILSLAGAVWIVLSTPHDASAGRRAALPESPGPFVLKF
jgi:hypothetical protein